jgi:hypothetical protein
MPQNRRAELTMTEVSFVPSSGGEESTATWDSPSSMFMAVSFQVAAVELDALLVLVLPLL